MQQRCSIRSAPQRASARPTYPYCCQPARRVGRSTGSTPACTLPLRMSSAPNAALIDAICEFLEAAVHTVLRARGVYSADLFERQRLYGIAVSKARHPELCGYIASVIANLKVGAVLVDKRVWPAAALSVHAAALGASRM